MAVKTRNRHLGYIRNVFSFSEEWNLIDADPFKKVNGFNDPHAKAREVAILTPEQLAALLRAAAPDFIPYLALSAFSWPAAGRNRPARLERDKAGPESYRSSVHQK